MLEYQYSFEKLEVWRNSKNFVVKIYKLTAMFPADEKFGLISQLRRAAVSISSNIAEGSSRNSLKDQIRFTEIAYGSALEVFCQLSISFDLGYISSNDFEEISVLLKEITNKLNALKKSQLNRLNENK